MARRSRYSPEVREQAVRMVLDHQSEHASHWEAIRVIASQIGRSAEALRKWVRQAEVDRGRRLGATSEEKTRICELERENRELNRANEVLLEASTCFAQAELDGPAGFLRRPVSAVRADRLDPARRIRESALAESGERR